MPILYHTVYPKQGTQIEYTEPLTFAGDVCIKLFEHMSSGENDCVIVVSIMAALTEYSGDSKLNHAE